MKRCVDCWQQSTAFPWVMLTKEDGALIGAVEFTVQNHKAELGYVLARSAWGQGFMTEAAQSAMDWLQTQDSIHRIWAVCDLENKASARVLEKLGMQLEGVLHRWNKHPTISDEPVDCYCYAWWK